MIEAHDRLAADRLPRPRLLACDIDGTLLDRDGALRDGVRDALGLVAASGVQVVLATGRSPWSGVGALADVLGLDGPQITMQGALISDPRTGRIRRLRALPPDTYREAIAFADRLGLDPIVTFLHGHRAERLAEAVGLFVDPAAESTRFHYERDLVRLSDDEPIRVFLPTGPERHWAVRLAAAEAFLGKAAIVWSDTNGLEILARGSNKGEALAWLAASRGIELDATAAIGDAPNDKEMLRVAGRSAAMGSAPADVRAAADVVVRSCGDDGVIDALRWFFPDLAAVLAGGQLSAAGMRLLP